MMARCLMKLRRSYSCVELRVVEIIVIEVVTHVPNILGTMLAPRDLKAAPPF